MASYNADINVNVKVFDQQLRKLENRIKQLDKIANPKKPLTRAQASEELEGAKRLAEQLRKGKKALEEQDALRQKRINKDRVRLQQAKEELAYEERLLRIQNARNLQEARLTALERAGAFKGKGRASEINKLKGKAQQFPENAAIQERVATALGRILTIQNAINRGEVKSVGQKQRIADYNARINALRKVGATEGQLREVLKRRYEFTEAADKRQTALADRRELQLKRQIKLLEKRYELELKAFRASAPIQSSLLSSGPARTVLGTPEAEKKKSEYYERQSRALAAQGLAIRSLAKSATPLITKVEKIRSRSDGGGLFLPSSKDLKASARGIRRLITDQDKSNAYYDRQYRASQRRRASEEDMARFNAGTSRLGKRLAEQEERRAKATERTAKNTKAIAVNTQKTQRAASGGGGGGGRGLGIRAGAGIQGLLTGGAFPALFGGVGAPGSIIGGGIGGLIGGLIGGPGGALAGSVALSAIGSIFDKLGEAALGLADAFTKATSEIDTLISALGRGAGDGFGGRAQFLASQGRGSTAASLVLDRFSEVYGDEARASFEKLGETSKELKGVWAEISVEFQRAMDGPLGLLLQALKGLRGSPGDSSPKSGKAGIIARQKAELQAVEPQIRRLQEIENRTEEQTQKLTELQNRRIIAEDILNNLIEGRSGKLNAEARLLQELRDLTNERQEELNREVQLEKILVTGRRDTIATLSGQLSVLKAQNKVNNLNKEISEEEKRSTKETARLLQLKQQLQTANAELAKEQAKQVNAELLAQRAIRVEQRNEVIKQRNIQNQIDQTMQSYLENEVTLKDALKQRSITTDTIYERTKEIVEQQRLNALEGVNELEVRNAINESYDRQLEALRETQRLRQQEIAQAELLRRLDNYRFKLSLFKNQQEKLAQTREQIRQTDPQRAGAFAATGLGFFAKSALAGADMQSRSEDQEKLLTSKLAASEMLLQKARKDTEQITIEGVQTEIHTSKQRVKALERQVTLDQQELDLFKRTQPAIDAAAKAQAVYNDALAFTAPAASAFVNMLRQFVDETVSGTQALSNFIQAIGEIFLQQATTMIAESAARAITEMITDIPKAASEAAQVAALVANTTATATHTAALITESALTATSNAALTASVIANTAAVTANTAVQAATAGFAEGGFVTGPTRAIVGEGSQPEYIIPENKMSEAMSRYNAGARGNSVIPGKGGGGGATAGASGGGAVINYNGPTLNFNSEDYVPTSAVAGIIDEATKRGAKAGEARTFATLRNSRSQRSRIGI